MKSFLNHRSLAARALQTMAAIMLLIPAIGGAVPGRDDPFASLVAAERAFAADAARFGITSAFQSHAASDSILMRPRPVPARELLAKQIDQPGLSLAWQPAIGAVSSSNDLGFTAGPYRMRYRGKVRHGQYLTVWQRDSSGRWRWFLDHGLPATSEIASSPVPLEAVRIGMVHTSRAGAASDFATVEDALNLALVARGESAIVDMLADDGYLQRPGRGPIGHGDAVKLAPDARRVASAERLGSRVSADDNLAVSYGQVVRVGAEPVYYVRIWRRGDEGWRLLVDQLP